MLTDVSYLQGHEDAHRRPDQGRHPRRAPRPLRRLCAPDDLRQRRPGFRRRYPTDRAALEAAHSILCDLRMEHGCEEWEAADWSNATAQIVGLLGEDYYAQETRAREIHAASIPAVAC